MSVNPEKSVGVSLTINICFEFASIGAGEINSRSRRWLVTWIFGCGSDRSDVGPESSRDSGCLRSRENLRKHRRVVDAGGKTRKRVPGVRLRRQMLTLQPHAPIQWLQNARRK